MQACWLQDLWHVRFHNFSIQSPVLLGRPTGLSVGDVPKHHQTGQPCHDVHGDVEGSPGLVTRVTEGRPSGILRCFRLFIALLVVIFSTWLAIAIGSQGTWDPTQGNGYSGLWSRDMLWDKQKNQKIDKVALQLNVNMIVLMICTGLAGLAAMWLYLIAPTVHILWAARFLCLNWAEGLVGLAFIAATTSWTKVTPDLVIFLMLVRLFLLPCEFLGLQLIIQNRLHSLWPALSHPKTKSWLRRCLRIESLSVFSLA